MPENTVNTLLIAVVEKPVPVNVNENIVLGHNVRAKLPSPAPHLAEEVTEVIEGTNNIVKVPFTFNEDIDN